MVDVGDTAKACLSVTPHLAGRPQASASIRTLYLGQRRVITARGLSPQKGRNPMATVPLTPGTGGAPATSFVGTNALFGGRPSVGCTLGL